MILRTEKRSLIGIEVSDVSISKRSSLTSRATARTSALSQLSPFDRNFRFSLSVVKCDTVGEPFWRAPASKALDLALSNTF
jgi:hypothetical protein